MSVRPIIASTNSFNSIQLAAECVCSLAASGRVMHGRFFLSFFTEKSSWKQG